MDGTDEIRTHLERLQRQARTDPNAVPLAPLVSALEHRDDSVSERAVTVLYVVSQATPARVHEAVPKLVPLLESDRSTVRSKSILTLSNVAKEHPKVVRPYANAIIRRLEDESEPVVRGAAGALRGLATEDPSVAVGTLPQLTALLSAEIEETRRDAAAVLEVVSADHPNAIAGSVEALVELLEDPYRIPSDIAYEPRMASDGSSPAEQMEGFRTLVADPDGRESNVRARESAARAIARFTGADPAAASDVLEPYLTRLFELLEDRNPAIRAAIAGSFAYVAQERPEAVQPAEASLVDLLEEPIAISGNAIWTLRYVGSERAVDALGALVEREDVSPSVRETAKEALEQLDSAPVAEANNDDR